MYYMYVNIILINSHAIITFDFDGLMPFVDSSIL